ncbi:hypothetical protein TOPH_05653 [Tolypocladium ophioglossoides CBS 100239]|uniref:NAD(P)-binding domain-containing protein n=1 Tax=Tolypocladium ophioglossoides (strain CBS 100239) TaxID=1163406 RepID=A0A0L0N6M0_TOLOC|nr:hypothetical protein TOPH_05653 [Tolypocladium ophioglossoides CBS 100239]
MHLILTGATGLVGSCVLDAMLKAEDITKISILSRRPVKMAEDRGDPRINVILHKDFETYDSEVLEQLKGADGCVWALGISQTKVDKQEYVKITKDFALAAARSFAALSPSEARPFRFVYVSGSGATQTPGRFSLIFARVKGEAEQALADLTAELPTLRADTVRPSYVDSLSHETIKPYIHGPGMLYNVSAATIGPALRAAFKRMYSPTEALGDFLTQMAMGKVDGKLEGRGAFRLGPSWVVENVGFRRIMGL